MKALVCTFNTAGNVDGIPSMDHLDFSQVDLFLLSLQEVNGYMLPPIHPPQLWFIPLLFQIYSIYSIMAHSLISTVCPQEFRSFLFRLLTPIHQSQLNVDSFAQRLIHKLLKNNQFQCEYIAQGSNLLLVCHDPSKHKVRLTHKDSINCGHLFGLLSNKGSVYARLNIDNGQMVIDVFSAHLTALEGKSKFTARNRNLEQIFRQLSMSARSPPDLVLVMGDLNYRLDIERSVFQKMIDSVETVERYLAFDELGRSQSSHHLILSELDEHPIHFPPTYKLVSTSASTSAKVGASVIQPELYNMKRIPSWCDRILYSRECNLKMSVTSYTSHPHSNWVSDHQPVTLSFNLSPLNSTSTTTAAQRLWRVYGTDPWREWKKLGGFLASFIANQITAVVTISLLIITAVILRLKYFISTTNNNNNNNNK
jgi:endonuclease/exonuclease/phosphatase family metal-dependent hydrolase